MYRVLSQVYLALTALKMKISILSILTFALAASAAPSGHSFDLVGFGKDNPLGPTTGGEQDGNGYDGA